MCKFLLTGDWHYRASNPAMRIDKYNQALLRKIDWICKAANEHEAVILNAGDVFDSPRVSYSSLNPLLEVLRQLNHKMVVCRGNHDSQFHSKDMSNTPYQTLLSAGITCESLLMTERDVSNICTMGWEEEPKPPRKGVFNILLGHAQVYEKEPPPYMPDALSASAFINKYPGYDFYCLGDIHIPCHHKNLIVPGSIMRSTTSQLEYKPAVWLLETDTGEVVQLHIPIEPAEKVFDLNAKQRRDDAKEVADKSINEFVDSLTYQEDKPDYVKNLNTIMEAHKPTDAVKKVVSKIMEVANV